MEGEVADDHGSVERLNERIGPCHVDAGQPAPQGTHSVFVEFDRSHGATGGGERYGQRPGARTDLKNGPVGGIDEVEDGGDRRNGV